MSKLFKIRFDGDKVIWRIVIFLSLFSILAIFSAASKQAAEDGLSVYSLVNRHLIFLLLGFVMMFVCHRINLSVYKSFATLSLLVSIGLLIYMMIFGETINNGTRWISIAGIRFQPVEIAKISVVLYLANVLENNVFKDFKSVFKKIIIPVGTVGVLTFVAGTSMGLLFGIICLSILFIGGLNMKHYLKTLGIALAFLTLLFFTGIAFKWPPRVVIAITRVEDFFNKNDDEKTIKISNAPTQSDYATRAVASGGLMGKGPGGSIQRHFLSSSHSDFIFAIIIEEYGLILGIILLLTYMALLFRAAVIAKKCTRIFSSVTVLGLMLMVVLQAMLNMAVSVGIFPVTGQTLPFISLGGTSVLCTGIAFGIVLSVSRVANKQEAAVLADIQTQNVNDTDQKQ